MMMMEYILSEGKWIDGGDRVLVHDGLKGVHIDAIAGVIWSLNEPHTSESPT